MSCTDNENDYTNRGTPKTGDRYFRNSNNHHHIWPDNRIERVHKCGTKQNFHGHAHQRDNKSNQTHAAAVRVVSGRVLPRRLNIECICAVCVMQ